LVAAAANAACLLLVYAGVASLLELAALGRINALPLIAALPSSLLTTLLLMNIRGRVEAWRWSASRLFLALNLAVIAATYCAYPFFPASWSPDFRRYVETSLALATGKSGLDIMATYHPLAYMLLASVVSSSPLDPLSSTRLSMLALAVVQVAVLYETAVSLFGGRAGPYAAAAATFTNVLWYYTVIETGFYANLMGATLSLYMLTLLAYYARGSRVCLALAVATAAASVGYHETSLLPVSAVVAACVYGVAVGRDRRAAACLAAFTAIALIAALLPGTPRSLLLRALSTLWGGRGLRLPLTVIRPVEPVGQALLAFSPLLGSSYYFVGPAGAAMLVLGAACGVAAMLVRRPWIEIVPLFWLAAAAAAARMSGEAIRLSLCAALPAALMTSGGHLLPAVAAGLARRLPEGFRKTFLRMLALLALTSLLTGSAISSTVVAAVARAGDAWNMQQGVLEAMAWIRSRTPADALIVSVARWQFEYTPYLAGRRYLGDYSPLAPDELARRIGVPRHPVYVVVWNALHTGSLRYVDLYESSRLFEKVWSNDVVTIFRYLASGKRVGG